MRLLSRLAIVGIVCLIAIAFVAVPAQAAEEDEPFITLSPSSGMPGEDVTVRGYYFDDNEDVDIYYYLNGSRTKVATEETDDDGDFRVTFTVPESYSGTHDIRVYIGGSLEATDEFSVEPGLTVDPEEGAVGTTVKVKGLGFAEEEEDIELRYYLDGDYEIVADDITADEDGSWERSFKIPPSSSGSHKIDARGDDSSFTDVEDAFFEVVIPEPVIWNLPWGLDADPAAVNIRTYPATATTVMLASVEATMPTGLLVWYYGSPAVGWQFYKKGWGTVNTLTALVPDEGYIGIVPTAGVWDIPQ